MNWKVWLLIIMVLGSLLAIFPLTFLKGVEIASLSQNSTAYEQGLRNGQIIIGIDGQPINNFEDFKNIMGDKFTSKEKIKLTITTKTNEIILFTNEAPEITVKNIEKTRMCK